MVSLTQSSSSFLFVSRFCVVLIVILATIAATDGVVGDDETQTDIEYFYLNDPSAVPVKEYSSESDIATTINDFQTVKGPKVVEFYSPLCVSCLLLFLCFCFVYRKQHCTVPTGWGTREC